MLCIGFVVNTIHIFLQFIVIIFTFSVHLSPILSANVICRQNIFIFHSVKYYNEKYLHETSIRHKIHIDKKEKEKKTDKMKRKDTYLAYGSVYMNSTQLVHLMIRFLLFVARERNVALLLQSGYFIGFNIYSLFSVYFFKYFIGVRRLKAITPI